MPTSDAGVRQRPKGEKKASPLLEKAEQFSFGAPELVPASNEPDEGSDSRYDREQSSSSDTVPAPGAPSGTSSTDAGGRQTPRPVPKRELYQDELHGSKKREPPAAALTVAPEFQGLGQVYQAVRALARERLGLGSRLWYRQAPMSHLHRLLPALVLCFCLNIAAPLHAADSVALENAKAGTTAWQLTSPATQGTTNDLNTADYANVEIQGYASLTSVSQGGTVDFHVRTINTNSYTLSVFRMGWYNGNGGRLVLGPVTLPGVVQPMPPAPVYQPSGTGIVECNWSVSYSLTVPTDWVSGIYLVKLALSAPAKESYIVFVVRDDTRNSPILFQSSVNTYQAYNEWGGSSLYTTNASGSVKTGVKVSFNRPYWRNFGAGDFMSSIQGAPGYEMQMVRWLESQGYDLTYATDVDTHENPSTVLNHLVFLVVGHDEYWSRPMRNNVTSGLDDGVHLGIFAANVLYWQVRFEPSPRVLLIAPWLATKSSLPMIPPPIPVSSPRCGGIWESLKGRCSAFNTTSTPHPRSPTSWSPTRLTGCSTAPASPMERFFLTSKDTKPIRFSHQPVPPASRTPHIPWTIRKSMAT
jgi:hypothetical protein